MRSVNLYKMANNYIIAWYQCDYYWARKKYTFTMYLANGMVMKHEIILICKTKNEEREKEENFLASPRVTNALSFWRISNLIFKSQTTTTTTATHGTQKM